MGRPAEGQVRRYKKTNRWSSRAGAGSGGVRTLTGRVESDQEVFECHGSGRVNLIRSDPRGVSGYTPEKPSLCCVLLLLFCWGRLWYGGGDRLSSKTVFCFCVGFLFIDEVISPSSCPPPRPPISGFTFAEEVSLRLGFVFGRCCCCFVLVLVLVFGRRPALTAAAICSV